MKKTKAIIFSLAFICIFNFLFSQENKFTKTYDLNYSLKKGTEFTLTNSSYFVEYKKVADDVKKFQQSNFDMMLIYKVIASSEQGIEFQLEYNDRNRENFYKQEIQKTDWQNLLGGKVKYFLSNKGEVSSFEDFDKLNTELSDGGNESIDQLKEEIIHLFPTLPENPVSIGDKWNTAFEGDENYESFSIEYILLDELTIEGINCLKIVANYSTEQNSDVTFKEKTYHLESNSTGHDIYYFAYEKGFLLSRYSIGNGVTDVYDSGNVLKQQRLNNVLYETNVKF